MNNHFDGDQMVDQYNENAWLTEGQFGIYSQDVFFMVYAIPSWVVPTDFLE